MFKLAFHMIQLLSYKFSGFLYSGFLTPFLLFCLHNSTRLVLNCVFFSCHIFGFGGYVQFPFLIVAVLRFIIILYISISRTPERVGGWAAAALLHFLPVCDVIQ